MIFVIWMGAVIDVRKNFALPKPGNKNQDLTYAIGEDVILKLHVVYT